MIPKGSTVDISGDTVTVTIPPDRKIQFGTGWLKHFEIAEIIEEMK